MVLNTLKTISTSENCFREKALLKIVEDFVMFMGTNARIYVTIDASNSVFCRAKLKDCKQI